MSKQIGARHKYGKYDPSSVHIAVEAVKTKSMSIRAASRTYGIPRATLFDKVNNRSPMEHKPNTVLTYEEEKRVVNWALHMARIGYGRTRQELLDTVKRILDVDQRKNPFKNNRPGKDWYYGFVARHPEVAEKMPMQLGKERAIITPFKVHNWFDDYKSYILEELKDPNLLQDPSRLYNADESGFSLCPKTGKVLSKKGSKTLYNFTSSDKTQITVLACISATGHYMKPLIVYPGQRFSYNPLEGFPEAVFGRTDNGWMDSELFCTWLRDVFIPGINERGIRKPVVLFVDGHSTHISLEVSDLCLENDVELYCLLEHASHIMQPCDLRLFSSLKDSWKQAVRSYMFQNIGEHVTKRNFATVFKGAWESAATASTAMFSFRDAGLFPLDPSKVLGTVKLAPSQLFRKQDSTTPATATNTSITESVNSSSIAPQTSQSPSLSHGNCSSGNAPSSASNAVRESEPAAQPDATSLYVAEKACQPSSLSVYARSHPHESLSNAARHTSYDALVSESAAQPDGTSLPVPVSDTIQPANLQVPVMIHNSLQESVASINTTVEQTNPSQVSSVLALPVSTSAAVSPFDTFLAIPTAKNNEKKTTSKREALPKAVTGTKFRKIMQEKQRNKEKLEREKLERKMLREQKRAQKEEENRRKVQEREAKKKQREENKRKRQDALKLKKLLKARRPRQRQDSSSEEDEDMPKLTDGSGSEFETSDGTKCYECDEPYDDSPFWIRCRNCPRLFHRRCVRTIDLCMLNEDEIEALMFECDYC